MQETIIKEVLKSAEWVQEKAAYKAEQLKVPLHGEGSCVDLFWKNERPSLADFLKPAALVGSEYEWARFAIDAMKASKPDLAIGFLGLAWQFEGMASLAMESARQRSEWAKLRHAETYALRDFAITYWRENIDPSLSADDAAEKLREKRIVPVSLRKLSQYVAAEKRKLRAASKR